MPISTRYLLVVSMDVVPEKEDLFNEVYDTEHVPALSRVPGVVSVQRFRTREAEIRIGGTVRALAPEGEPAYTAVYEIESPDVLVSDAWAEAGEAGRWASEVRPFTTNRRLALREIVG